MIESDRQTCREGFQAERVEADPTIGVPLTTDELHLIRF